MNVSRPTLGKLLALPSALVIFFFMIYPLIYMLYISFTNFGGYTRNSTFVGLNNFVWVFQSGELWHPLINSSLLTLADTAVELVIGLAIALLLNEAFRGRRLIRALVLLPWATPSVVAAYLFVFIFDGQAGALNIFLRTLGIPSYVSWLSELGTIWPAVISEYVWKGLPFVTLVLLAGLQAVPSQLREAARVDGATGWKELRYITLPSIKFAIVIAVLLRAISTFNLFESMWLMTGGGPGEITITLPIRIFDVAFEELSFAKSAALSVVALVILGVASIIFVRIMEERGE